jgi:beta-lactamase regulating signal transducer with metallopeptidase domain
MKKYFIILILIISGICSKAQQQEVPYTLADRDRLIQVEANVNGMRNEMNSLRNEMDSLRNEMNAKFETVNAKIDYIFWMMGVLVAFMIFMLGFMIWDRRTTLAPVKSEIEELKLANEKMKDIFRQQSEFHPQLREILKKAGIL